MSSEIGDLIEALRQGAQRGPAWCPMCAGPVRFGRSGYNCTDHKECGYGESYAAYERELREAAA